MHSSMDENIVELNAELGQVWTPFDIAIEMVNQSFQILGSTKKKSFSILDPASGPATFQKALCKLQTPINKMVCYDIDPAMASITNNFLSKQDIDFNVFNSDYLLDKSDRKYDLIIVNPPYIRHEKFESSYKEKIKNILMERNINKINGRSNLFIYFLMKGLTELNDDGILCAIVYDSILYSKYGKDFLSYAEKQFSIEYLKQVTTPFENTIIDASIIIFKKTTPSKISKFFENLSETNDCLVCLSDLLNISRGTSFPSREIFIASQDEKFYQYAIPIVMKPSDKKQCYISNGDAKAYFFGLNKELDIFLKKNCDDNDIKVQRINPKKGKIFLNYYIRNQPKHLYNENNIIASDNFYVGTPKDNFPAELAWLLLNSTNYKNNIMNAARNQGNGLKKLQAYEYKAALVDDWRQIDDSVLNKYKNTSKMLIHNKEGIDLIQKIADEFYYEAFK